MPVYNARAFLNEAIDSILNQTFSDFEFLIIDDGSTDDSMAIVESYLDPRIRFLPNEANRGIVYSLNRGLEAASGKYIARMDADDVSLPDRLALQSHFLDEHPEVALVGSNTILINATGDELEREYYPTSMREIRRAIFIHNPFAHGSVMIRGEAIRQVGRYDHRFLHNEDYDLWLRIARKHQLANLKEHLLKRRIHNSNITVAKELELVRYRMKTLSHAAFCYYRRPDYAFYLLRPAFAYLYRLLRPKKWK